MTLAEARADLLNQSNLDVDLYTGVEIDPEGNQIEESSGATALLSRACVWWSKLTYCNYEASASLTLTVDKTTPYDCRSSSVVSKRILKPRTVVINDSILYRRDGREHGLWTMGELQRAYPSWRTAASKQPSVAIWLPNNKLQLWPPTDDLYTGKNFIEGWILPDEITVEDDDEELPVPEEDHMSVIRLALVFGTLPNLSEAEAWQRAAGNDAWWREQAERRKRENLTSFLGRKPRGEGADWLYG
jgi:hypothetical protein